MRFITCLIIVAFCCDARYIPEDGIYSVAEHMPEYEAGMDAFENHISQYISSTDDSITGSVFVSFIITTDGKLQEVKVVKSLNQSLDQMALDAVNAAPHKWKPGEEGGKAVNVKMVYPIHFVN